MNRERYVPIKEKRDRVTLTNDDLKSAVYEYVEKTYTDIPAKAYAELIFGKDMFGMPIAAISWIAHETPN